MAAPGQRRQNLESPSLASDDAHRQLTSQSQSVCLPPAVARIADAWLILPPHIREAIQTLVDAALPVERAGASGGNFPERSSTVVTEEVAWRMAQECRGVVQCSLREEEWQDADRELFAVIRSSLKDIVNGLKVSSAIGVSRSTEI